MGPLEHTQKCFDKLVKRKLPGLLVLSKIFYEIVVEDNLKHSFTWFKKSSPNKNTFTFIGKLSRIHKILIIS